MRSTLNLIQLYQATEQIGAFQRRVIQALAQVLFTSLHQPQFWTGLGDWMLTQLEQWSRQGTPPQVCRTEGLLPLLRSDLEPHPFSWRESIVIQAMGLEAAHQLVEALPLQSLEMEALESLLGLTDTLVEDSSTVDPKGFEAIPLGLPMIAAARGQAEPEEMEQAMRRLPSLTFTICAQAPMAIPAQRVLGQWVWELTQRFGTEVGTVALVLVSAAANTAKPWQEAVTLEGNTMLDRLHWRLPRTHQLKKLARFIQLIGRSTVALAVRDLGDRTLQLLRSPLWRIDDLTLVRPLQFQPERGQQMAAYETMAIRSIRLAIHPGPWVNRFQQVYGAQVLEQLSGFSQWAGQVLSIHPEEQPLAAKLAILLGAEDSLEHPARVWTVSELLEAVGALESPQAIAHSSIRRHQVFQAWNQALCTFHRLGWSVEFDSQSYPTGLRPDWSTGEARGMELSAELSGRWLEAKLNIGLTGADQVETAGLVGVQSQTLALEDSGAERNSGTERVQRVRSQSVATIPGYVLEQALARRGMSQAKLARCLNLDRSTVSRWIKGSRPIHARYRSLLWELLGDELQQGSI